MNKKLLSFLGICKKSGNLSLGFESCIDALKKKKSHLILIARDLSENTKQKLYKYDYIEFICPIDLSMEDINLAIGSSVGIISVNDKNLAEKIKSLLK